MEYTIYHGTLPTGRRKIGVDSNYPNRIKAQKLTDHHVMEVHTCVYEVSEREMELQRLHDVKVDTIPYHVTYHGNQNPFRNAKVSASLTGRTHSEETKAKFSAAQKGVPKSEDHKAKISAACKGVPHFKVQCPHCDRTISTTNIKRHIKANHANL